MRFAKNLNPLGPSKEEGVLRHPPLQATVAPSPSRNRFILWCLAAACLMTAVGVCLRYRERLAGRRWPPHPATLHTAKVRSGTIEQTVRLAGATVAERSVYLRAPYLRGRRSAGATDFTLVLRELVPPGTRVRRNDRVAVFDRLSMRNRLDRFRAARVDRELSLRTMVADLAVKRAAHLQQIRMAKARMDTAALDLRTAPVRSAIQVALYQMAFEEAKAEYEALVAQTALVATMEQAGLRLAHLELREAQLEERRALANADKMVVRAPVDGLFVLTEIRRGSTFGRVRAGDEIRRGQPFAQIVDPDSLVVQARANQVDIGRFSIGASARVRLDALPDLKLPATVECIGPLAKGGRWRSGYVAEVPVFLRMNRKDPRLIPNLTVSADIVLSREWSLGIIPRAAVFQPTEGDRPTAYVRSPSGWQKRYLEVGLANNTDIAVRSGLRPGESVSVGAPSG